MRRLRRAKIVATLGPASSDAAMIAKLFKAGADVFRINMSHTSQDRMREIVGMIRGVEKDTARPIGILVDLQGPKLRLGTFAGGSAMVEKGASFLLDGDPAPGDATRAYLPHPEIFAAVAPGRTLLIDDGKVRLTVTQAEPKRMVTRVEVAGKLSDRKGVSLPDSTIPFSALAEKDRSDLEAALNAGIDWVALSFIQRPEDIAEAKKITRGRAAVMAKIEKPQAVTRLAEIMELADALMVARGDLGVEMPLEKVPGVQKQMTRMGRVTGKPVVVATQMLESMINSPVPTRAEVSDVATAIFEGADAVMLSAESAAGKYPIEAVSTMNRIAEEIESDPVYRSIIDAQRAVPEATGADAIADAARQIADTLDLAAVVCWTASGSTALQGGARAAAGADRGAVAECRHRPAPRGGVGRALRRHRGRARRRRHGRARLPHRVQGRLRQSGTAHHHGRRRAVRHPGRDQYAAHCLCGERSGGGLNIPALDLFLQGLDQLGNALDARVDRQRAAIDFQRLLVVADVLHDQAEAGKRAEVARLAAQHLVDIGKRATVILFHVVDGSAPVPGFHVFRLDLDDGAEQLEREVEILGLDRVLHARHQEHRGVAARVGPQRPDALLDRLGGDVVGRNFKRPEQKIEIARGVAARHMRQFFRRQHLVARRRQGGRGKANG